MAKDSGKTSGVKKSAAKKASTPKSAGKAGRPPKSASKSRKAAAPDGAELLKYYRDMLMIRRFEEKAGQLYGMGLIGGFCHLYIGQEAVVTGLMAAASSDDSVITTYRDHGHMLACGMDPKGVMAELTGRSGGYSRGKGGSMHMFSVEKNFYGGHGIVGANVPIGTGLAFAEAYKGTSNAVMAFFGDGASNQGQVYEAFNMAELWKLPIIYVIENNQYAMGTALKRSSAQPDLHRRGEKAIAHCRDGKGPIILEMMTYRYRGHSMSDPAKYRTKEEVAKVRKERDPIDHVRDMLLDLKISDEVALKAIDKEVKAIVTEAAEYAQHSPEPDPSELYTDVLIEV